MSVRKEILEIPDWWEIGNPISEIGETTFEFERRQTYVYETLFNNSHLTDDIVDWDEFEQLPEESYIDYAIRFNNEYAYLLDVSCFVPELYHVKFDYYKNVEFVINKK